MSKPQKPSYLNFDIDAYPWKPDIDYRKHPEKYRVGKGEQGVLICEPYKSEIGQYWRFKTPEIATQSSQKIVSLFNAYLKANDFVGADMARKYLQMGYTRARRYANYKGGKNTIKIKTTSPWNAEQVPRKKQNQQKFSIKPIRMPKQMKFMHG